MQIAELKRHFMANKNNEIGVTATIKHKKSPKSLLINGQLCNIGNVFKG